MSERCPHRWLHGVMTCPHCGNNDRGDNNVDALKHELNDWRQFGFAQVGPPITCDQDMRDGIEEQFRELRRKLAALETEVAAWRALASCGDLVLRTELSPPMEKLAWDSGMGAVVVALARRLKLIPEAK